MVLKIEQNKTKAMLQWVASWRNEACSHEINCGKCGDGISWGMPWDTCWRDYSECDAWWWGWGLSLISLTLALQLARWRREWYMFHPGHDLQPCSLSFPISLYYIKNGCTTPLFMMTVTGYLTTVSSQKHLESSMAEDGNVTTMQASWCACSSLLSNAGAISGKIPTCNRAYLETLTHSAVLSQRLCRSSDFITGNLTRIC